MSRESLSSYASSTVSPSRSREQVEELLIRVGAAGFRWESSVGFPGHEVLEAALLWEGSKLAFRIRVRFEDERQRKQKMRALFWYMKTKIEAIQMGLVDLQHEFLPYLLTQSGRTVYEELGGADMKMLAAPQEAVEE